MNDMKKIDIGSEYHLVQKPWTEFGNYYGKPREYWELHHNTSDVKKPAGRFLVATDDDAGPTMSHSLVHPKHRNKGLGSLVYKALANHYGELYSDSTKTSRSAKKVWEKIGGEKTNLPNMGKQNKNRYRLSADKIQKSDIRERYQKLKKTFDSKKALFHGDLVHENGQPMKPDDVIDVYHATDEDTAQKLLQGGFKVGQKKTKPATVIQSEMVAKALGKKVGDTLDYEPGRGLGQGLYVSHSPERLGHYGSHILKISVPVSQLKTSPERSQSGRVTPGRSLLLEDGYIENDIHPSQIQLHPVSKMKKSKEVLQKGQNGDWKKEGYTLSHEVDEDGDHMFLAKDKKGNTVGNLTINLGDFDANNVVVHPAHQRKGIASGLYSLAEQKLGIRMVPSDVQTPEGEALWNQTNRPFGKSQDDLEKGQNGDWEKEGYTFKHHVFNEKNQKNHHISAHDKNGEIVGFFEFNQMHHRPNELFIVNSEVHPQHQRKGLASAAYKLAQEKTGATITPETDNQTDSAKALWSQPNRPFGKSKDTTMNKEKLEKAGNYTSSKKDKDPPTLDYSKFNKPAPKPQAPTQDYSTHVHPQPASVENETKVRNNMINKHNANSSTILQRGRNKEIYVTNKPKPLQKSEEYRARYSKIKGEEMQKSAAEDKAAVDSVKAKYQEPKEPSFSQKVDAIKAKYASINKPKAMKKSDEAHAPGSPKDSSHDVVEENSPIQKELDHLKQPTEKVEFFKHLASLTGKNLRSKKNQDFGKE